MIVITLAGESSRFFNEGFTEVKYKLLYHEKSIIESILDFIPRILKVLIVSNDKFKDSLFLNQMMNRMGFVNFEVVEISSTIGQLESVYKGLTECNSLIDWEDSLTIFNGDTIRKMNNWDGYDGDGYIEVFEAPGTHWSFVDQLGKVNLVTEKERISSFCSSGFYYFSKASLLNENYHAYKKRISDQNELYIAPFYNYLIQSGYDIRAESVDIKNFVFCGTPNEYRNAIDTFNS